MTRWHFFFLLSSSAAWLLSTRGHAVSQPAAKVPRIGVLVSASEPHPFANALRHGLQNLGYSEGRNITLDVRYTQGRSDLAAQCARAFNGIIGADVSEFESDMARAPLRRVAPSQLRPGCVSPTSQLKRE
jgi:hypothetical protein